MILSYLIIVVLKLNMLVSSFFQTNKSARICEFKEHCILCDIPYRKVSKVN